MEEKIIKTNVLVNDVLFNETAEQPIDVDFSLPDFCPDISKILKCRAVSLRQSVPFPADSRWWTA